MVRKVSIGVIGIQGAVSEHVNIMQNVLKTADTPGEVFVIKNSEDIKKIDALILPGGESTTISRILCKTGLHDVILKKIENENLPVMGTCAGCVLLASELVDNKKDDVKLFQSIDMQVERNAFGKQKESFEENININGFNDPYNAVFIRAPIIKKVWGNVKILAKTNKKIIVMARQDNILALSFHPELTNDPRVHRYFLDMI
jgi:5'-phosphate synthase pdxT subunit